MENSNLPMKVGEKSLTKNLKRIGIKTAKIVGSSVVVAGFLGAFGLSVAFAPVLTLPSAIAVGVSAQKLLNNTKYKSYKDLAFVTREHKGKVTIGEDLTRMDLTSKMRNMSNIEKVAFMQLQTLVGLTKFNSKDKKGEDLTFETKTHGVNQKTFKKLQELGYIKDYEESFYKESHLLLPKLAFLNFRGIKDKTNIYNVNFKLTGKKLDLEDENLRRYFPMVLGDKNGIVAKRGYNFVREEDGSLTIDYNPKEPYMERKQFPIKRTLTLRERLSKGMKSLEEQKEFSDKVKSKQAKEQQKTDKNNIQHEI